MNVSLYYDPVFFDAEWALHHLVRRIVGAVYSGIVQATNHFVKLIDFIIIPKAVTVEGQWSNYVASNVSLSCTVNITAVSNPYVVVVARYRGNLTSGSLLGVLNGVSMTKHIGGTSGAQVQISGIIPVTLGSQTLSVGNIALAKPVSMVVYLLSGVNQSVPLLDANEATATATTLSTPSMASSIYGLVIDGYANNLGGVISVSSRQTTTSTADGVVAGLTWPAAAWTATSMANTVSECIVIAGVSMNPA